MLSPPTLGASGLSFDDIAAVNGLVQGVSKQDVRQFIALVLVVETTATHANTDHLKIQYISGGRAHIRIGGHSYSVQKGDVIIYNAGVIHDERADPDCGMSFYNCGIKNFHLPQMSEGHLLAHDVKPVLHRGNLSDNIRAI